MARKRTLPSRSTPSQPTAKADERQTATDLPSASGLVIPGAPRPPRLSIDGSMIWIYGDPKIGKTTFASMFDGVWFIATERGQEFVECREPTFVSSWDEFLNLCAFIQDSKPTHFGDKQPIRVLCIDVIDRLFAMCQHDVCQGLGVEDLGELPHGKGWARLTNEWERVMTKVRAWPFTLICISHPRQREFKTRARKIDRWEPYIGAAGFRWCQSTADLILYAFAQEVAEHNDDGSLSGKIVEERRLLCHPQSWAVAGGRMSEFLPEQLPLDYGEFKACFKQ